MSSPTASTAPNAPSTPPVPARRTHVLEAHGDRRIDDWYWLREKTNPEVLAHLQAENEYTKAVLGHTTAFQQDLYAEMLARIQETDDSVPAREGPYFYYQRTVKGLQYPIHCRKRGNIDAAEEVILDENELAKGCAFFDLGGMEPSADHRRLAYTLDATGDEIFSLKVKDLETGATLPVSIPGLSGALAFAGNDYLFYVVLDAVHRPYRVMRHRIGDDPKSDVEVYRDDDERFFVGVGLSRSGAYVMIDCASKTSTEVSFIPVADPTAAPVTFEPRREKIEYSVEHQGERFLIVTNEDAVNSRLMETRIDAPHRKDWREIRPHRQDVHLKAVDAFKRHLVISERREGVLCLRVIDTESGVEHEVAMDEPVYSLRLGENLEYDTDELRFVYSSMITPSSVFDYDMNSRTRVLKKQQPVLGGYDKTRYRTERLYATAPDGARVPISIVFPTGFPKDGSGPLVLWGYGSYGLCYDPSFSSDRISLLDRGIAVAIAHPRGGGEMGRTWYDAAKWLTKSRTFDDFIACAEELIASRWTSADRLAIVGGSAGGMLIGAALNARPGLFRAALAQVPFVDVLTSMLDETLPLTVAEFEEWGDPKRPEYYAYMKSYSPYDNVKAQRYPDLLVTAGLNDPRVPYWEPAKWVAKLRTTKLGDSRVLFKVNLGAGHQGASGRYDFLKERAFEFTFLLDCLGRLVPAGTSAQVNPVSS